MTRDSITRRRVLAAVGSVGFLTASARVGRAALDLDRIDYPDQQQIRQADSLPPVLLRWREMYDGEVIETPTQPTAEPAGPVIDLNSVLPGDGGSLAMEVELGGTSSSNTAHIRMFADVYDDLDNGINEPELDAGDAGSTGDLDDAVKLTLRYDRGCNAVDLPIIPDDPVIASGTVREVAQQLSPQGSGIVLDPPPGTDSCLSPGGSVCLYLQWDLPEGAGNVIQGDSLGFRLVFAPEPCSGGT